MTSHNWSPSSMESVEGRPYRRVACNSCKHKKIKCEWDNEYVCNRCIRYQTECIVTSRERKKRVTKGTRLSSLERRLKRIESAVTMSDLDMQANEPKRSYEVIGDQDIPDKMSMLKIYDNGTALFVGSSSGFSIFSPQGLNWISDVTGSNEFTKAVANISRLDESAFGFCASTMWHKLPEDELEPLPSKENAVAYIDSFFHGLNSVYPLFDRSRFEERFLRQYPVTCSQDVAWYACLNIVFAIGSVIRSKTENFGYPKGFSPRSPNVEDEMWWKWFRNASSTFIDLQFRAGSLGAVQAMIGMTFILQTIPNPYPCFVLASAALRLAQSIGLHRNLADFGLTPVEIEERRNIFWTAVVIERGIILRSGRPSAIHENDIGIDLPKPKGVPNGSSAEPHNLRYMATLALLQGRIYNKLYSAKSLTKSKLERLKQVGFLDAELQHWREMLPIEIRPGNEVKCEKHLLIPVLMMHFTYFNALTTIHRVSIHHGSWTKGGENSIQMNMDDLKLNPRVFASGAICVGAARSVIDLLKLCHLLIDTTEINIIRMLDYYPLTAALTLFANVLQNPLDPQALSDIEQMNSVTTFLSGLFDTKNSFESSVVVKTVIEINGLAARHVEKARAQGTQAPKRSCETSELVASKNITEVPARKPPPPLTRSTSQHQPTDATSTPCPLSAATPLTSTTYIESSHVNLHATPTPTPTSTFRQLQSHPHRISDTQQFLNDRLAPQVGLHDDEMYGNANLAMGNLDVDTALADNHFMPWGGTWFFPLDGLTHSNKPSITGMGMGMDWNVDGNLGNEWVGHRQQNGYGHGW